MIKNQDLTFDDSDILLQLLQHDYVTSFFRNEDPDIPSSTSPAIRLRHTQTNMSPYRMSF